MVVPARNYVWHRDLPGTSLGGDQIRKARRSRNSLRLCNDCNYRVLDAGNGRDDAATACHGFGTYAVRSWISHDSGRYAGKNASFGNVARTQGELLRWERWCYALLVCRSQLFRCLYLGDEKAYQKYENLRVQARIARTEREAAEENYEAQQQMQMNMMNPFGFGF